MVCIRHFCSYIANMYVTTLVVSEQPDSSDNVVCLEEELPNSTKNVALHVMYILF